ncbi:MAG: DNA methyltransferase [Proteobacteria bacterium]|nr:DNA methyltransferase [Pseudomonadota bacterium]
MTLSSVQLMRVASSTNIPLVQHEYSRIAKIHKYWSRKPWSVIDHFIDTYSDTGQVLLDPFCGSGVVGLQALKAGRNFIGSDLNPFAIRLTKETLDTNFDEEYFNSSLTIIRDLSMNEINRLYEIEDMLVLFSVPNQLDPLEHNAVVQKNGDAKSSKVRIDLNQLPKIKFKAEDNPNIPDQLFPKKFYKDRFSYKGISKISELFSDRNLKALSIINDAISKLDDKAKGYFELCLTNTLLHVSKLKSERVRPLGVNNFWIPDDFIEENVWWRFEDRCKQFAIAKKTIKDSFALVDNQQNSNYRVEISDATKLQAIQDESIDYILTDPPYGEAIQYSELSIVWNCWIRQTYETKNEIIINPEQEKSISTYSSMLNAFILQAARVLRKNGKMTISFHSKDIELWCELARSLHASGFEMIDLYISHGVGSPFTKNWAKFSPKSDIYITVTNSQLAKRKLTESSGQEFFESLREDLKECSMSQQQVYDYIVLAAINATMSGISLSGMKQRNMASLLSLVSPIE